MARKPKVVIAGGGIGGLTAGIALERRGIDVEVYEQAQAIGEIGAGLTLSPNALKAYEGLGVRDAIEAVGFEAQWQVVRRWNDGAEVSRVDRSGYSSIFGAPYISLHRADFVDVLAEHFPAERLHLQSLVVGAENTGDGAVLRLADGREIEADLVVGADGVRSAVRASLHGADSPRFTGTVCFRGLVPFEKVAAAVETRDWTLYVGPERHVIYYMVRRGDIVNFVAHVDTDTWTGESWTQEADPSEITDTFAGWHEPLLELLGAADEYYKWALFDRDPLPAWTQGRITLLGDAAHAMPPFIGQGAGMSVEDAYVLAAAVAASPDDIPTALARYEGLRLPRANEMVLRARAGRDKYHLKESWDPKPAGERNKTGIAHDDIYHYDVREVDFGAPVA